MMSTGSYYYNQLMKYHGEYIMLLESTTAGVNLKKWQFVANPSGQFYLGAVNDAESVETQLIIFDHSNNAVNIPVSTTYNDTLTGTGFEDIMQPNGHTRIGDLQSNWNGDLIDVDSNNGNIDLTILNNLTINGSAGYTGTVTTGSLVGKTITITKGIITGFA